MAGLCKLVYHRWAIRTIILVTFLGFFLTNAWFLFFQPQTSINPIETKSVDFGNFEEIQFSPLLAKVSLSPSIQTSKPTLDIKQSRVLVAHEYVPYANHHGADTRLMDVLTSLVEVCSEVRFVSYACLLGPHNTEKWEQPKSSHIHELRSLGVKVECETAPETVTETLTALITQFQPDFLIGSLWFWTWPTRPLFISLLLEAHLSHHTDKRKFIVLSDDVHSDREQAQSLKSPLDQKGVLWTSQLELSGNRLRAVVSKEVKSIMLSPSPERLKMVSTLEVQALASADAVLAITKEDMTRMHELVANLNIFTIRPTAPSFETLNSFQFNQRFGFVFLGSGQNPTNVAAIQWFISQAWPLIRLKIPAARLLIGGGTPPGGSWAPSLSSKEKCKQSGVTVLGFVKDISSVVSQARVFVSPVRVASGFNTKNLVALSYGLPLVTTMYGNTGLPSEAALVAGDSDSGSSFADLCVKVHEDASIWSMQHSVSLSVSNSFFSAGAVQVEMESALTSISQLPLKSKTQVFTSSPFLVVLSNPMK